MIFKTTAAALGAACFFVLPAAYAFDIVADNSGFAPPVFFASDPGADDADAAPVGNPFITALGPYEYRTPADAFDEGFSYSGYAFEDEKLADHSGDAKAAQEAPAAPKPAIAKLRAAEAPR
jgi:hypothetical protein